MKTITLPAPTDMTMSVSEALRKRRTCRDPKAEPLCDQELSNLLWACAGITDQDGRRTVPSTLDLRAVEAYVLREDGSWHYDPKKNTLEQTATEDVREVSTSYQFDFVKTAPVTIVFVADLERSKTARAGATLVDAGTMGQAVFLASTAMNLSGGIRASFDHGLLRDAMKLPAHLEPILLFTVGHHK